MPRKATISERLGHFSDEISDYIRTERQSIEIPNDRKDFTGDTPKEVAGVVLLWAAEYINRGLRYVLLDNKLLRSAERRIAAIKPARTKFFAGITRFLHKRPWVASYLSYYIMLAGLLIGGHAVTSNTKDKSETRYEIGKDKYVNLDNFVLDPTASYDVWQNQIDKIAPFVVSHIFFSEGFVDHAYRDKDTTGTLTIGAGFTIEDDIHKKFAHKILKRSINEKTKISIDEARELVDAWMRGHIYPKMRAAFERPIPARMFIVFAVAAYNVGENVYSYVGNSGYNMMRAFNSGASADSVIDLFVFSFGKTRGSQWGGLSNKYGVCALYALGEISESVIMNSQSGAPYSIEQALSLYQKTDPSFDKRDVQQGRLLIYNGNFDKARAVGVTHPENIEQMLLDARRAISHNTCQRPVYEYMGDIDIEKMSRGEIEPMLAAVQVDSQTLNKFNTASKKVKRKKIIEDVIVTETGRASNE